MTNSARGGTLLRTVAACAGIAILGSTVRAGSARAADQCISPEAQAAMKACGGGAAKTAPPKKSAGATFHPPKPPTTRPGADKPGAPKDLPPPTRDDRAHKLARKSVQLLVTELQNLESLFGSTKKTSPDRPKLARRLAEGYAELESAALRNQTESEIRAEDARKKKDGTTAKEEAEKAAKAKGVVVAARKGAIKYYTFLKNNYATWCLFPNAQAPGKSQGCGDEVLYYLAYEHEQAKDLDQARKVYFELLETHKTSRYRPNAYLAFGELFFQEAQSDASKWGFAQQSYEEAAKYPPPDNKLYGYALYKLAYVHWNQGEHEKAADAFKKVIEHGTQHSTLPNAKQLATAARRDIIPVYALWGDPKKAFGFFKPLSGDPAGEDGETFRMMSDLGVSYLDTGHYDETITLFNDLMSRDKGARSCEYHGHIAEATMAKKSGSKDDILRVLDRQLAVYKELAAGSAPDAAKVKCGNLTVEALAETAMAWHLEAVGSNGVRGTNDRKTMKLAADLYQKVTGTFTQSDFDRFTFPRFVKEDWPSAMKLKYLAADLLYSQSDWERCGPAFDAVVAENPKGALAPEAAFTAALCYQNLYTERHRNGSDRVGTGNLPGQSEPPRRGAGQAATEKDPFTPRAYSDEQKGMLAAFDRYLCAIQPDGTDPAVMDQLVEIKFARARTHFDARHWEEAALGFRDIALNHAKSEVGPVAANLYLEAANILATRISQPREACLGDLERDTPELVKLYCSGDKRSQNESHCAVFTRVERDIRRLKAEALVKACDAGGPEAIEKCRTGGQLYLEIWEQYGRTACEKNDRDACARNDEVLHNAARAFQAARLVAKSIAVRKILLSPKYNLHETALAKAAAYDIGGNYQAIAVYDEAAAWYERFAAESPKDERAPQALSDAIVLRLGLGQDDKAIEDEELFRKTFANRGAQAAQIAFAIGAHYAEDNDWSNAKRRLAGAIAQIDRNASVDVRIQAHALLGRAHAELGARAQARAEYEKVRSAWADPDKVVKEVERAAPEGETEAQRERRLGKVLEAVGEAHFFFAEERKVAVDALAFPEYRGSGQRAEVERFVKEKVGDWQKRKRAAIEQADQAYQKILTLSPAPPPRWVIAAGARVGQMKGKFVAEFRAAPIPDEWKQNGPSPYGDLSWEEIRAAYYNALDEASEPDKRAAKAAYKTCLDLSVKHQYFDRYSRSCEAWLAQTYPAEYHLIDEFRSAPNRVGSGSRERAAPLSMTGAAVAEKASDQRQRK